MAQNSYESLSLNVGAAQGLGWRLAFGVEKSLGVVRCGGLQQCGKLQNFQEAGIRMSMCEHAQGRQKIKGRKQAARGAKGFRQK